jgi:hypothetical protein
VESNLIVETIYGDTKKSIVSRAQERNMSQTVKQNSFWGNERKSNKQWSIDEQSAKGKAYSNIYSVSNTYIYIYITPEGTGIFLYGTFLVDETTKERASTYKKIMHTKLLWYEKLSYKKAFKARVTILMKRMMMTMMVMMMIRLD